MGRLVKTELISSHHKRVICFSTKLMMGVGRVEQYHTHAPIVDRYKILPIPIPIGMKLYPHRVAISVGYPMDR
jgi:hypothetical protein